MSGSPFTFQKLEPGDRVRLVSPASFPDASLVEDAVAVLEDWGLVAEVAPHALDRWGYMAGHDQDRLADLNDAFRDPDVRAIVATRGGAGAYRLADDLDVAAIRADPKPLVGFSDITYLHLTLASLEVGAIHGCLVGRTAIADVHRLLMSTDAMTIRADPHSVSGAVRHGGVATGRLVGGNLAAVATSIGTGSVGTGLPSLDGAILFLEDQRLVGLGTVDRQLTQLLRSGALDGVAGIALGSFQGFDGLVDRGWSLVDVVGDRLGGLGIPVLGGIPAGHDLVGADGKPDQVALPLGAMVTVDADAATLTAEPLAR